MGTTFTRDATKQDIIKKCTTDYQDMLCLAHQCSGNTLWSVWENTKTNERFIYCDLLRSEAGFGWGYKPMSESMHPYYYTCPLKYLDMVPRVASQEWRDKVRAYWQDKQETRQKANALEIGQTVQLPETWRPNIFYLAGRQKKTWIGINNGRKYRLPVKSLADAVIISQE